MYKIQAPKFKKSVKIKKKKTPRKKLSLTNPTSTVPSDTC